MMKKLLIAVALTAAFFNQSAWCMEQKDPVPENIDIEHDKNTLFIRGKTHKFSIELGKYLSGQINRIEFSGPSDSYSIEGTTFDELEKAGEKLEINLKGARNIDWKNLNGAMEKYKEKHGHSPALSGTQFTLVRLIETLSNVKFIPVYTLKEKNRDKPYHN